MFSEEYRENIRNKIIEKATLDPKVISAAVIGSYARNEVDEWSDIDLTFGITKPTAVKQILEEYKNHMQEEFSGEFLFKLVHGITTYGVFILPGCLQVDLSFSMQEHFGPKAYPFKLLFGTHAGEQSAATVEPIEEKFGLIAHHLLRLKVCVEREAYNDARSWLEKAEGHMAEQNSEILEKLYPENVKGGIREKLLYKLRCIIETLPQVQARSNQADDRTMKILSFLHELIPNMNGNFKKT